jgi:hypothetical protein
MKRNYYFLLVIVVFSLACGVQTRLPDTQIAGEVSTEVKPTPETVRMVVMAESLNIRTAPSWKAPALYKGLKQDDVVTVYLGCNVVIEGETQWLAIEPDCNRWVSGNYLTLEDR